MKPIGIMAAMPDEIRPFLRLAGTAQRVRNTRFPTWRLRIGNADVFLMESGMGISRAAEATEALVAEASPAVILSFGFGGAVVPGMGVGDLAIGVKNWLAGTEGLVPCHGIDRELAGEIATKLDKSFGSITRSDIITTPRILSKGELAHSLPAGILSPILDMETAAVAEAANRHGIPLVALRAVSDDAAEELSFSLDEFTGQDMTIRPQKVLATIVRKPWIVPQLLRLARNSRVAGRRLAQGALSISEFLSQR